MNATFSPGHYHKETKISTRRQTFTVVKSTLSQAGLSRYQKPACWIRNPYFVFLSNANFSNAIIDASHIFNPALRFALPTRPLSLFVYADSSCVVKEYLSVRVTLTFLPIHFSWWFTMGFHKLRFFFPFNTYSPGKVMIIMSTWSIAAPSKTILAIKTHSAPLRLFDVSPIP